MKFTVFFVEDEITIREMIRESIAWESTEYEYLGDAPDGETAIRLISELQPDIVVTDIRMPHMDGLDLCRCIQYECPDTCVIILSGYNDFVYAQKAIHLNVSEYLLKPITPANLMTALNNAARRAVAKREDKKEVSLLKEELLDSRPLLKERFLQGLMTGTNPADAILRAAEFGLNLRAPAYSVVVLRSKVYLDVNELSQALRKLGCDFPVFRIGYREAGMLAMAGKDGDLADILEKTLREFSGSMVFLSNPMQIERGRIVNRLSLLNSSFQDACARIDPPSAAQGPAAGVGSAVATVPDVKGDEAQLFQGLDKTALEDFLNCGLRSDLETFLDAYLSQYSRRQADRQFSLYSLFLLKFVAKSFLEKLDIDLETTLPFPDSPPWQAEFPEIRQQYKVVLAAALQARDDLRNAKSAAFLGEVRQTMDREYGNPDISLETLARSANVNPSYLSTAFKQHFKQTISKYLIEKRLKKAMELLRTTGLPVAEISARVGYINPNYFSVLFKKVVGKTPREYRNEK